MYFFFPINVHVNIEFTLSSYSVNVEIHISSYFGVLSEIGLFLMVKDLMTFEAQSSHIAHENEKHFFVRSSTPT